MQISDYPENGLERLIEIMRRLRAPGGCPWDQEQTHETIKPQLIEECYEVIEAIESGKPGHLREELGDLLLHVVFHCQLSQESGDFNFESMAQGVCEKLIRRHPHVFGQGEAKTTAENSSQVLHQWEEIKKQEKPERTGVLDGVPRHLPALMRAQELSKKAARVGFDWPEVAGVRAKIDEELAEVDNATDPRHRAEEIGDLLFAVVNLARHYQIDAEQALSLTLTKFSRRFSGVEKAVETSGRLWKEWTLEELETEWQRQKQGS